MGLLEAQLGIALFERHTRSLALTEAGIELLRGLQASHHVAVIYITHDLSTVRYFSERIFVMYAGNLVEKAPVEPKKQK